RILLTRPDQSEEESISSSNGARIISADFSSYDTNRPAMIDSEGSVQRREVGRNLSQGRGASNDGVRRMQHTSSTLMGDCCHQSSNAAGANNAVSNRPISLARPSSSSITEGTSREVIFGSRGAKMQRRCGAATGSFFRFLYSLLIQSEIFLAQRPKSS
uniref:Uncharacterized protein n=1 Tax=Parascaris univalens TaxID=6257 RepID=A0A915CIS1_PARUN